MFTYHIRQTGLAVLVSRIYLILILILSYGVADCQSPSFERNIKGIRLKLPSSDFFSLIDTNQSKAIRTQSLFNISTYTKGEIFENFFNIYGVESNSYKKIPLQQFVRYKDSMVKVYSEKPLLSKSDLKASDTAKYRTVIKDYYKQNPAKADSISRAVSLITEIDIDYETPVTIYNTNSGFINLNKVRLELNGETRQLIQVGGQFRLNERFITIIGSFEVDKFINEIQQYFKQFIEDLVKLNP